MALCRALAVCVLDPGSHFLQSWNTRIDALEISNLRSPALAHPATRPSLLTMLHQLKVGNAMWTSLYLDAVKPDDCPCVCASSAG